MKKDRTITRYPRGFDDGPWGVRSLGMQWHVVNELTGESYSVGMIGRSEIFKTALEEATRRNIQEGLEQFPRVAVEKVKSPKVKAP
jgi:hypothetical protein